MKANNNRPRAIKGALALVFVAVFVAISCTKIEQPELDGRPLKRPVSVVVVK